MTSFAEYSNRQALFYELFDVQGWPPADLRSWSCEAAAMVEIAATLPIVNLPIPTSDMDLAVLVTLCQQCAPYETATATNPMSANAAYLTSDCTV